MILRIIDLDVAITVENAAKTNAAKTAKQNVMQRNLSLGLVMIALTTIEEIYVTIQIGELVGNVSKTIRFAITMLALSAKGWVVYVIRPLLTDQMELLTSCINVQKWKRRDEKWKAVNPIE
jgi:hypothetical protein